MKKTKQMTVTDSNSVLDLKSMIHEYSLFIDILIELIPAKFYFPNDGKDKPWFQGLSKAEKDSAKKESKENTKKARRDRLDPENSSTTTLVLLNQKLRKEKIEDETVGDEMDTKPMMSGLEDNERKVTYEDLRQRLHRKLEEFRTNRNLGTSNREKKRNERKEKVVSVKKKRKRDDTEVDIRSVADKTQKDLATATKELAFSHVKLGKDDAHGEKKRKLSKSKQLEIAKKLEEEKKDPEKGEIISKKHSWKAATSRAAGIKIHDDPKLLSKSIRKEKMKHEKNAKRWSDRMETTEKEKAEKQQKRSANISKRSEDKKMRRIAKREKKLLRPGFEGRKEGFINPASHY